MYRAYLLEKKVLPINTVVALHLTKSVVPTDVFGGVV